MVIGIRRRRGAEVHGEPVFAGAQPSGERLGSVLAEGEEVGGRAAARAVGIVAARAGAHARTVADLRHHRRAVAAGAPARAAGVGGGAGVAGGARAAAAAARRRVADAVVADALLAARADAAGAAFADAARADVGGDAADAAGQAVDAAGAGAV